MHPRMIIPQKFSRTLLDCTKRLFSGNEKNKTTKKEPTQPLSFSHYIFTVIPIYHLAKPLYFSAKPYTIWRNYWLLPNCIGFCQIVWGFCQIVSLLPNRMRFCQKVSLSPNYIRLSPNRLYFLAKEPQNTSSPAPECKIAPKNTR